MPRIPLAFATPLAIVSVAVGAGAQAPTILRAPPPLPSSLPPAVLPPPPGASDAAPLPADAASLPLRLSLLSTFPPLLRPSGPPTGGGSGCSSLSVAAAGTIFPTRPYAQIPLAPRLVLHGFSDLGCPGDPYAALDAGAGGGLTYALPLSPTLWLVPSAGGYVIPSHDYIPARGVAAVGLDLAAKTRQEGVLLTTGIGVSTIGRGVRWIPRIGGTF